MKATHVWKISVSKWSLISQCKRVSTFTYMPSFEWGRKYPLRWRLVKHDHGKEERAPIHVRVQETRTLLLLCLALRSLASRWVLLLYGINVRLWSKVAVLQGFKPLLPIGVGNGRFRSKIKGLTLKPSSAQSETHSRLKFFYMGLTNSILGLPIWNQRFQTFVASPSNSTGSSTPTTFCLINVGYHLELHVTITFYRE